MAGRSYPRLRVPTHPATSEVLAGAYPFLAEEGLGSAGILIRQDAWSGAAFCFDPWELYSQGALTNPNMSLAGQIGRGKSTLAKSLATRCIAFGRRVYVPGDPKGEWTVVARALGGTAIQLGVGTTNRLNPLDEGPRPSGVDDGAWRAQVDNRRTGLLGALGESTLGRPLGPTERSALDAALADAQTGPRCRSFRWSSTLSSTQPDHRRAPASTSSAPTAGKSATPSPGSCVVTSADCSTGPPPSASTPPRRCSPWTCRPSPAPTPSSVSS